MKNVVAILALCAMSTSAFAQSRPALYTMTCSSASALVSSRGAVVADTGPNSYERLVRDAGQCNRGETAVPYFSPTKDRNACMVGYECRDLSDWDPTR